MLKCWGEGCRERRIKNLEESFWRIGRSSVGHEKLVSLFVHGYWFTLVKALDLKSECGLPVSSSPHLMLALWSWVSHLTSLSLHVLSWKVEVMPHPSQRCCENYINRSVWKVCPSINIVLGSVPPHSRNCTTTELQLWMDLGAESIHRPIGSPARACQTQARSADLSWPTNTWTSMINDCCLSHC